MGWVGVKDHEFSRPFHGVFTADGVLHVFAKTLKCTAVVHQTYPPSQLCGTLFVTKRSQAPLHAKADDHDAQDPDLARRHKWMGASGQGLGTQGLSSIRQSFSSTLSLVVERWHVLAIDCLCVRMVPCSKKRGTSILEAGTILVSKHGKIPFSLSGSNCKSPPPIMNYVL